MKKIFIGTIFLFGILLASTIDFNGVNGFKALIPKVQKADAQSNIGCISRDKNDGKCFFDGTTYFCGKHFMFHNCVLGIYPE